MTRQRLRRIGSTLVLSGLGALALAGCASRSPTVQLHRLPSLPPAAAAGAAAPAEALATPAQGVWQLMLPVTLPQYLDRDALLVPQGATGLQPLPTERWGEPLRDALPRLLLADLARLRGSAPTVSAPLPAGLQPTRQLRVELLAFEAAPERQGVVLQARWSLADAAGATAPVLQSFSVTVPSAGPGADALVAAHRLALWRLAERIVRGN